jgi:hypothetical protein
MQPLAIKCYLPGRRTQYVLYPSEDMSIELGVGADLCPRGFDPETRVSFRLVSGQWFVEPQSGSVSYQDGQPIEGLSALALPALLLAGSATLVLDSSIDPRVPARVIQGTSDAGRQSAPAPGPAPVSYAAPRAPRRAHAEPPALFVGREQPSAWGGGAAATALAPQPRAANWKPQVAPGERAPALEPLVEPSVVVHQAEQPARRQLDETRILDMTQLGVPAPAAAVPADGAPPRGMRALLAKLRGNPRMLAYAVLGVALVAFQFGMRRHQHAVASNAARPRPVASAGALQPAAEPAKAPRSLGDVEPLPEGMQPDPDRAARLFAVGDYRNALRQYRALAAAPNSDPVFGVISHALEQRLRHLQVHP